MSKPQAPPPPDPSQTINAQTASNEQTARTNAQLNRVNQYTPFGSVTYGNEGDTWSQTVTESPAQAQLRSLNEQQGAALGQLGIDQTNRVSNILSKPYESRRIDLAGALGNYGEDVENRTFDLATKGLDREFDRSEESLRTRLANQGINAGTDAFDAEMRSFNEGKGDAFSNAMLNARDTARTDRSSAMSEALGQYGIDSTADLADRQNPLNEIIALMGATQTTPINPGQAAQTNVAGTDVAGITNQGYANRMSGYNTQMQSRNATLGALARLGGAAFGAM